MFSKKNKARLTTKLRACGAIKLLEWANVRLLCN